MTLLPGPVEGARAVVVTSLEMRDPAAVLPARDVPGASWFEVTADKARISAEMYARVGAPWSWVDRASWTPEQWQRWTDRPEHHLGLLVVDAPYGPLTVGYAELESQPGGDVEIAYLGLLAEYTGRGLGPWLLAEALRRAWALPGTRRVWVHTCDLDSPGALAMYRARGLVEVSREVEWRGFVPLPAGLDAHAPATAAAARRSSDRADAYATWSLVTGILAVTVGLCLSLVPVLPIAAILLGYLARARIDDEHGPGWARARAGMVLGYAGLALSVVIIVILAMGTFLPGSTT